VLGHIRVDADHLYVTESSVGAIIIIERRSGRARRVLAGHPKLLADPHIVPVIEGREFRSRSGKVPIVNASLIELSMDGEWLYFNCLFGPMLRRVPVERLLNDDLSDETIGNSIEDIVPIPPCAGIAKDNNGMLYLSSFTNNSILRLNRKELEVVASHPRIAFPNESSVGPDNWFYVPACQANRISLYQQDGISMVKPPWEVLRFPLY
jgi:Major royal jelly protein